MAELTPSTREVARRIGVTETALRKAAAKGRIEREADGQWDVAKKRPAPDHTQQHHGDHSKCLRCSQHGEVQKWVNTQWKISATPGQISVEINSQGAGGLVERKFARQQCDMAAHPTRSMQVSTGAVTLAPSARGRIAVIQPAPGLMLEAEWMTAVPVGGTYPMTRLALKGATQADYAAMTVRVPEAAAILANAGAGIIGYAGGIKSLAEGPEAEQALMDQVLIAAVGIRAVRMAEAAEIRMRARRVNRSTLITPYAHDINALVQAYLVSSGVSMAAIAAAGFGGAEIIAAARTAVAMAAIEMLWIPCSSVSAIGLIGENVKARSSSRVSSIQGLLKVALAHPGIAG